MIYEVHRKRDKFTKIKRARLFIVIGDKCGGRSYCYELCIIRFIGSDAVYERKTKTKFNPRLLNTIAVLQDDLGFSNHQIN